MYCPVWVFFRKIDFGFWFLLRTTDFIVYKHAIRLESISKMVGKCKLHINFLSQCRDTNIIASFTNLKKLKQMSKRSRFKFCRKLLYGEISSKHKNLKELCKQQQDSQNLLKNGTTWIKQKCTTYSINCVISKYVAEVKSRHARNCPLNKSNAENGIQSNPNNVVWNLSSQNLTNENYDALSYGLNHGLATNLTSNDVLPSIESVRDQLARNNLLKENYHSINRLKKICKQLPSTLSIWITKKYLKIKINFKS